MGIGMRFWRPNRLTLAWFLICFAVGIVFVIDLAVKERYRDLVVVLLWRAGAGAFSLSEWRGVQERD
jgi:hypothetical protein